MQTYLLAMRKNICLLPETLLKGCKMTLIIMSHAIGLTIRALDKS